MNDIIWSINIMLGTLLGGVGYFIYWIMTYDNRTQPGNEDSSSGSEG